VYPSVLYGIQTWRNPALAMPDAVCLRATSRGSHSAPFPAHSQPLSSTSVASQPSERSPEPRSRPCALILDRSYPAVPGAVREAYKVSIPGSLQEVLDYAG